MRYFCVFSTMLLAYLALVPGQTNAAVIFGDSFNSGASSLWGNEVGNWTASGGFYDATSPGNLPNAFSSLPFSLTDLSFDVDVNRVTDGGVWLRSAVATGTSLGIKGVLLVTGASSTGGTGLYWHIVTDGTSYGGILNPVSGLFAAGSNPHIRVEVTGNTYAAFVNGSATAATTLTTSQFASGRVALYDFSVQTFDNVVLAIPAAVPEPSSMVLLATGALGLVAFGRRRATRRA